MRIKALPRQHQFDKNVKKIAKVHGARISTSESFLRFIHGDLQITMEHLITNQSAFQDSGPGIDEALDLAMPTRSRCNHERYTSCYELPENLVNSAMRDEQIEAIDLSIVKRENIMKITESRNELEATFLYKMLTDSSFLENLRDNRQRTSSHSCPFCKKKFSNENDLTEHLNVRKDESNQIACCACGKKFAQKRYLRYHQRCHSERSKFTCEICTKNYSRLDNLTRHNTFHTNPDKFPCTTCERTFARKDLLKKHIKCHENRLRYHCSICDKYFKGPLSLENHKKLFHSNV